jgi:regulatory protein
LRWEVVPGSPPFIVSSPSALFPSGSSEVRELKESPRTPGRYVVVLSGGQRCVVGAEALAASGATRVGASLDAAQLERLLRASAITALVDRALNALARARRTRRELEIRLRRVEPDAALVAEALDRLQASGVLSDADVARAEAASRLRRGEGTARVNQVLRRKGIDARSAAEAIAEAVGTDGFDEVAACRLQAEKRWRSLSKLEPVVARRRLAAYLQRRGFGGGVIRAVIDELQRG